MLLKWIALMLLAAAAWWLLRGRAGTVQPPRPATPRPLKSDGRTKRSGPQTMVACCYCDLHLPLDEAFMSPHGRPYCSEAHRIAHLADPARRGSQGS